MNYKTILYQHDDGSWAHEVFNMIAEEYREKGISLPADIGEVGSARL
jgi:hypothetical protein